VRVVTAEVHEQLADSHAALAKHWAAVGERDLATRARSLVTIHQRAAAIKHETDVPPVSA
jgi:hypothetical protein